MRLSGLTHGLVTKTVHKTLPGDPRGDVKALTFDTIERTRNCLLLKIAYLNIVVENLKNHFFGKTICVMSFCLGCL